MKKNLWVFLSVLTFTFFSGCGETTTKNEITSSSNASVLTYTDTSGNTRTAALTAGAAEYHTGLGYGETMFDSAENKCQHCHNDLYDTWKDSMHAKSWKDGIFQAKFQDFLRMHIAKIGENPTGSKLYDETVFKGAAQTCIRCHAPGAFYAGDFKVDLTVLEASASNTTFTSAISTYESNLASLTSTYDPTLAASVVSVSNNGTLYKATYQIGHEANREGINCATCHSIEQIKMMKANDTYTLKADMRSGPHGAIKAAANTTLTYNGSATNGDMNKFFRLWGPEKNSANSTGHLSTKASDGRYTFGARLLHNSTQTVYTGGPFYGPFGATGTTNENTSDVSNRTAISTFDNATNNHFGNFGKALCLSCHQRSAGAFDGVSTTTGFMELCSTWNAMSDGVGDNYQDSQFSPKCQKCHMEKIEGTVLHQWGKPTTKFTLASNPKLTSHFNPDDTTTTLDDNPVKGGWLNSHAFLGGSAIGVSDSYKEKIKSGFEATTKATLSGSELTVTTTFTNKTAHMFPGAHPMRRVLSKIIVRDSNSTAISFSNATGISTFGDITNTVKTINGKKIYGAEGSVDVIYGGGTRNVDIINKTPNLTGGAVSSQKFETTTLEIPSAESSVRQSYNGTHIVGSVKLSTIANSTDATSFIRIYGHETGKNYSGTKAVRPGFDSNLVFGDNRLEPNETETYTIKYDVSNATSGTIMIDNRIYFMQKGASGVFPVNSNSTDSDTDGFLDSATNSAKKLMITEIYRSQPTVTK